MSDIILNKQQEEAVKKIERWYNTPGKIGSKQIFILAGYAGTGKTTVINYLVNNVLNIEMEKLAFATPTGKAASILIQKGIKTACTVHRLIYLAKESEELDSKGKHKTIFVKKTEIPKYDLIILDEVSMISKNMMKDILSFNCPVLAMGDPGQLPPVMAEKLDLLEHPDYMLTEIARQAADNPIIQLSMKARKGEFIREGRYGDDVIVMDRNRLPEDVLNKILNSADQIICGKNSTRIKINDYMRALNGHTSVTPEDGEKIICYMNNYEIDLNEQHEYQLVNGLIGTVNNFKIKNESEDIAVLDFKPDFLPNITTDIISDAGGFLRDEFTYDRHQKIYTLEDGSYTIKRQIFTRVQKSDPERYAEHLKEIAIEVKNRKQATNEVQISQFMYGYCITVHKAQGSEWNNVVVFDESDAFPGCRNQFLYTAITRAKKKLVILK